MDVACCCDCCWWWWLCTLGLCQMININVQHSWDLIYICIVQCALMNDACFFKKKCTECLIIPSFKAYHWPLCLFSQHLSFHTLNYDWICKCEQWRYNCAIVQMWQVQCSNVTQNNINNGRFLFICLSVANSIWTTYMCTPTFKRYYGKFELSEIFVSVSIECHHDLRWLQILISWRPNWPTMDPITKIHFWWATKKIYTYIYQGLDFELFRLKPTCWCKYFQLKPFDDGLSIA